jgi:hypothetical protein
LRWRRSSSCVWRWALSDVRRAASRWTIVAACLTRYRRGRSSGGHGAAAFLKWHRGAASGDSRMAGSVYPVAIIFFMG